jgi:ubiquinone/menaquinone biosynthesis C-methylase UbiE
MADLAQRVRGRLGRLNTPANASRVYLDRFVAAAAASVPPGALVLDAGAGDSVYRGHFAHTRYESADFGQVEKEYAPDLTYVCDLTAIPVNDARYDLVALTQVLEHLPEPTAVLRELRRVLKPGAKIWASAPLYFQEHEQPYDFYRYTQFGLRRIFTDAGFHDVEVEWLEGYWMTVGHQIGLMTALVPRWLAPVRVVLEILSNQCARRDLRHKRTDVGHPKNYTIVATA